MSDTTTQPTRGVSIFSRFRRWLAYRIMPGTNEYRVALARQRALQELDRRVWKDSSQIGRETAQWAFEELRDAVPVREAWDRSGIFQADSGAGYDRGESR